MLAVFPKPGLVFSHPIRFHCWFPVFSDSLRRAHAIVAVLAAHPERESEGGGDRVASVDAACGHDPAGSGGGVRPGSAGLAGGEQGRNERCPWTKKGRR